MCVGRLSFVKNFVIILEQIHQDLSMYKYTSLWWRAFGAPRGSAPMARYYDPQLRSLLHSLLACRAFVTPKDNGVDALIDIFLITSLEYHLM